jgi:hypothetical protein
LEARKATAAAMSSVEPKRLSGLAALIASLTESGSPSVSSVTTNPGAMALTVIRARQPRG